MRRLFLRTLGLLIVLGLLYLLFWPIRFDPVAWTPPAAPELGGRYAPNERLAAITRLGDGVGVGPEDITHDAKGNLYTGYEDGRIVRFTPDARRHELFVHTGGLPLGMRFDRAGNLIVADAVKGLLSVAPDGKVTVLATQADGGKFAFTNHLAIATDGTIYFSDSSTRWGAGFAIADIFEHIGTGRLMAYDPAAKKVRVLLKGLQFANGVALSADESFVLVVETGSYRIRRYWLKGPGAGTSDMFFENLPGFPDNISSNGRGTFWLAMFTVRNPTADGLAGHPFLRRVIWRLPQFLQPGPAPYSFVLGLDEKGKVRHNLQDPKGRFSPITAAVEANGKLYFGSLSATAIGWIKAP